MQFRNTTTRWGGVSQLLHWTIVALVITQFVLGTIASGLPLGLEKLVLLARHKSIGITILALALVRLTWRVLNPTPPLPVTLNRIVRGLAHGTHAALYALLIAMPLTGWIMSSARSFSVSWFNLFQLPDLVSPNPHLYDAMVATHDALAWTLGVLASLHALAALVHHFWLKDDVLERMLPITSGVGRTPSRMVAVALALVLAGHFSSSRAAPVTYRLSPAGNSLSFHFTQAGARDAGHWTRFDVRLALDPAALQNGRLEVIIQVASLDTGDKTRDDMLRGTDFFDTAHYPEARFTSSSIRPLGGGRYQATGTLSIRGVARSVMVPFTLTTNDAAHAASLTGQTVVKRLDFGVGQGEWKSTQWIGADVTVSFALRLGT